VIFAATKRSLVILSEHPARSWDIFLAVGRRERSLAVRFFFGGSAV